MENNQNAEKQAAPKRLVSETGHAINLRNFALLIKTVEQFSNLYNPANPALQVSVLQDKYNNAASVLELCTMAEVEFDRLVAARSDLFKQMKKVSSRAHRSLKASPVPQAAIEQAQSAINKLRGSVSNPKKKEMLSDDEASARSISNSQQSYIQLIEHFRKLREILVRERGYAPNEADLSIAKLKQLETNLIDANDTVNEALTYWRRMRHDRIKLLYDKEEGLVNTAFAVKNYVASLFGSSSIQYKETNKISFRNIAK